MNEKPIHAPLSLPVVDDRLQIGGMAVAQLADRIGRTPFYAYDRQLMIERVAELRRQLPEALHLHYAIKANPMPAVVQTMAAQVDGLDVASLGELQRALDSGMAPTQISFAGPGKGEHELAGAIAAGIVINLESEGEMERAARIAAQQGRPARVAVRVNPDFELKSSGMKMTGGAKAFGVDAERVPAMLRRIGELSSKPAPLEFWGFHIFSGSQNLRAEALIEAQNKTIELAIELAQHAPAPVRLFNIGGGFGVPYFPGERRLDLEPIATNLRQRLPRLTKAMPQAEIVMELGRYLVAEAGIYVVRVVDRKISKGQQFVITDGGLHHHLAASGNFGQVIRKNYPVVAVDRVYGAPRERVNVVGPLCTPLDLLANQMELGQSEVGDLIAVMQSGAYGLSASPRAFLSHPEPGEVLV